MHVERPSRPAPSPATAPASKLAVLPERDGAALPVPSVLIVDDGIQNVELLQAYLEDVGCEIRTAHDGPEALTAIERKQPDLILLDIMMPTMSGFQICKQVKSNPTTRDIQVIMVTALNETADIEKARECGTDDFVTKPVNRAELVLRVKARLSVRLLKQDLDRTIAELKRLREKRDA